MKSLARDYLTDHLQIIYHFFTEKLEQRGKGIVFFHRNGWQQAVNDTGNIHSLLPRRGARASYRKLEGFTEGFPG